jgi:uncharacterized protein (TIGR02217 family)
VSDVVFPGAFAGLRIARTKSPRFATNVQTALSGREFRDTRQLYPTWDFKLSYEVLRENAAVDELRTIAGFFLARRGMFDSWLYLDPNDSAVTDQQIGVGDGANRNFQLVRAFGYGAHTFVEPVMNPQVGAVKVNGVEQPWPAAWGLLAGGVISFAGEATPANGAIVTWSGNYYHRCRFLMDVADFDRMAYLLWELKRLEFKGAVGNRV